MRQGQLIIMAAKPKQIDDTTEKHGAISDEI
jgi:hypothetical protein